MSFYGDLFYNSKAILLTSGLRPHRLANIVRLHRRLHANNRYKCQPNASKAASNTLIRVRQLEETLFFPMKVRHLQRECRFTELDFFQ